VTGATQPPPGAPANEVHGIWLLTLRTPIGTLAVTLTLHEEDGVLTGNANGAGESVPLRDIRRELAPEGERLTWTQTITKPLRLTLGFDVVITGDRMAGHSRAGRLPRTTVSGIRETGA